MTVKEMKKFLEDIPDDAKFNFAVWREDKSTYESLYELFNFEDIEYTGLSNEVFIFLEKESD